MEIADSSSNMAKNMYMYTKHVLFPQIFHFHRNKKNETFSESSQRVEFKNQPLYLIKGVFLGKKNKHVNVQKIHVSVHFRVLIEILTE